MDTAHPPLIEVIGNKLRFNFHKGQVQAWNSEKRVVAVCAGTQGGKTSWIPIWLWREIKRRGPGDYGYISPTYSLMERKALPDFVNLFDTIMGLGKYYHSKVFEVSAKGARDLFGYVPDIKTKIFFGYAENPDSLESSTYKGVVCDEAGQKQFKTDSYYALRRRTSIHKGRLLIATTPYSNAGWLRTEIHDKWAKGDPDIDFIRFPSIMNPAFPRSEYEWAHANLPKWKARMFYDAEFERPAGLIYDCFNTDPAQGVCHTTPRFTVPERWQRYLGLDFGGVNTAGTFFAEEPGTRKWYAYREYKAGGRTAKEHAKALLEGEPMTPICFGGSQSEGQWRDEFRAAGLPVREPDQKSVEVGITRVYGAIKRGEIMVFDDLKGLLEEIQTYSYKVDDKGEPLAEIEDKETYHALDSCRYIISPMKKEAPRFSITVPKPGQGNLTDTLPKGVFG